MSITLSPETLAQFQAVANQRRLPPEDALTQMLAEAQAAWYKEQLQEQQEVLEGVARSEADFAAGRTYSLEETMAGVDAIIKAKRQQQDKPTEPEYGYEYLKRILPTIELITLTDEDLANVHLNGPLLEHPPQK